MGLDASGATLLLECARNGVAFDRTLMIGRQNFFVGRTEWRNVVRHARKPVPENWTRLDCFFGAHAEPFFKALGATQVNSLDATDYEGADRIHDLNQPVPADWRETYDAVFDGGSLEHVFQFPTALNNALQLVRPGGHYLAYTPANNYFGHGFYQFSPELIWRVFNPSHGFELERLIAVEFAWRVRMFSIRDPREVGERICLLNRAQVLLFVCARKTGPTPEHFGEVMQSDYAATWKERDGAVVRPATPARAHRLLETAPVLARFLERTYHRYFNRKYRFSNHAAYRPHRPDY